MALGGKRKGAGRKKGAPNNGRGGTSPEEFMKMLVPAQERVEAEPVEPGQGFGEIPKPVDPVEFCMAVINGDGPLLTRLGVIELPTLDQRLFAARVAVKYTNQAKPAEVITKHQFSWVDELNAAENRLKELRKSRDDNPAS
jgi:hypothetical protein